MFDLDIQKKLDVLKLADALNNVTEATRLSGVSHDTTFTGTGKFSRIMALGGA